jgi:hypothetical protein
MDKFINWFRNNLKKEINLSNSFSIIKMGTPPLSRQINEYDPSSNEITKDEENNKYEQKDKPNDNSINDYNINNDWITMSSTTDNPFSFYNDIVQPSSTHISINTSDITNHKSKPKLNLKSGNKPKSIDDYGSDIFSIFDSFFDGDTNNKDEKLPEEILQMN